MKRLIRKLRNFSVLQIKVGTILKRENEVASCMKIRPICLTSLYGDMWRELGIKVHFSDVDNDDTLAAYAQNFDANILSRDKDFYRYKKRKFKVFAQYQIQADGCLYLYKAKKVIHMEPRTIINPLPITYQQYHIIPRLFKNKVYIKGISTPFMRLTGNLYKIIRPLRQVMYSLLGISFAVNETLPTWNDQKREVLWVEELIEPATIQQLQFFLPIIDHEDNLLILLYFFRSALIKHPRCTEYKEILWTNHLYCFCAVISELLAIINLKPIKEYLDRGKEFTYFLDMFMNDKTFQGKFQDENLDCFEEEEKSAYKESVKTQNLEDDGWSHTTTKAKTKRNSYTNQNAQNGLELKLKLKNIILFLKILNHDDQNKMEEPQIYDYIKNNVQKYERFKDQRNSGIQIPENKNDSTNKIEYYFLYE
eukprot:403361696